MNVVTNYIRQRRADGLNKSDMIKEICEAVGLTPYGHGRFAEQERGERPINAATYEFMLPFALQYSRPNMKNKDELIQDLSLPERESK